MAKSASVSSELALLIVNTRIIVLFFAMGCHGESLPFKVASELVLPVQR